MVLSEFFIGGERRGGGGGGKCPGGKYPDPKHYIQRLPTTYVLVAK